MKKKAIKKLPKKIVKPAKGKFKNHNEEEKRGWLDEEKDWKKDELEDESPVSDDDMKELSDSDDEDDWIEKENGGYDEEVSGKMIDDDLIDDKDNY
jgi:hypothetical protein